MAEVEKVSESDRIEQASLERVVADAERVLLAAPVGTRPFFHGFLDNARARLGTLQKKIEDGEKAEREAARNEMALVALANEENALSQKEKESFSGFLKKDFFTKSDFSKLEEFYAGTWDRRSERGKDEMSERVWEGIRRNEYTFSELPASVQEKEQSRVYAVLTKREKGLGRAGEIPQSDRTDFIQAYESGNRGEAGKILDRPSFRENMFRRANSSAIEHSTVVSGKESQSKATFDQMRSEPAAGQAPQKPPEGSLESLDLSSLDLSSLKVPRSPSEGLVAALPKSSKGVGRET
jgi:hypothetical protein